MEIKLTDLKKLAIDNRVEITYRDSKTGRICKVNKHGIAKVPDWDMKKPIGFRIDDVLNASDEFIIEHEDGEKEVLTREQAAQMLKPKETRSAELES